jgi:uncharacterized protein YegP (UPF0339 family)
MRSTLALTLSGLMLGTAVLMNFVLPAQPAVAAAAEGEKKSAATFEIYKDKGGDYRWRLRTTNTQVIATSGQGYSTKRACEEGIESVKKNAPDAAVEEKAGEDAPAGKD